MTKPSTLSDYDRRQIDRIRDRLIWHQDGKLSFHNLVFDIEGLINALENVPEEFRASLQHHWGVFDEVYAVMADEERQQFDDLDRKLIDSAVKALLELTDFPAEGDAGGL